MAESTEHKVMKEFFGILLGQTECPTRGGRVDACNSSITVEVECGTKKVGQRVCKVDFRKQPDAKIGVPRPKPFASLSFTTEEVKALGPILKELKATQAPT